MKGNTSVGIARFFLLSAALACLTVRCAQRERKANNEILFSNPFVADSVTYEFVNAALSQEFTEFDFQCEKVTDRDLFPFSLTSDDSLEILSMDSLFTKSDVEFIYKQLGWSNSFKLNHNLVEGRHVIQYDSVLANKEKYSVGGFCHISMPLFTQDMSTAIVRKGMICGRICGEVETLIYSRKKDKWELIYTLVDSPEI
ncbi:hypothetical protein [Pontibacter pamirensis]|uniref:hypothetical protein n=1 Tax=Pontibacter pamirensis TaxID=2562824 RepID=UPI00138A03D1|nr:hypothetical protein [Pontibacter pamirensis]